jgi:predicted YcjX-like family ATPase
VHENKSIFECAAAIIENTADCEGQEQGLSRLTSITDEALIALDNLQDSAGNLFSPTLRLGVTGLSRAGKTVFITSLIHNLLHGGRLPLFEAHASGRISRAELKPQPSMNLPRFQYEGHIRTLLEKRQWPDSTRAISEVRLTIHYESASAWSRRFGAGTLNLDIVDYPGEWLLDLPLLGMTFEQWSQQALALARLGERKKLSREWLAVLAKTNPEEVANEQEALTLSELFTSYLRQCRSDETALSTLPPGRFLMPGDLEGSPALTFAPLDLEGEQQPQKDSLHEMMARRFEAYKDVVVRPFFREHFARLDRQIVLVDALQAINAGPAALADLEAALAEILACFKTGTNSWLSSLLVRRIDRILFAATKADHLHHENHDRMEALLERLVERAMARARYSGAKVDVVALAAIRATREGEVREGGETYPVITGTPMSGESINGTQFKGDRETAIFPGDLPLDPSLLFDDNPANDPEVDLRFVRFRPPGLEKTAEGLTLSLPHIRLDRALSFLLADQLA